MTSEPQRRVELATLFNLRDLGGYPAADGRVTRWRRLFRADGLQRAADADRQVLVDLGIRTVVDLRRPEEIDEVGRFSGEGVAYHHLSVQPYVWDAVAFDEQLGTARYLADRYLEMTRERGEQLATVLRLVADDASAPLAFHCAAGKDRTGVVAALTLGLLGVGDDVVAADYALSGDSTERWLAWARVHRPHVVEQVLALPGPWHTAPAEAMVLFLDGLRAEHGSVDAYASSVGVGPDVVEAMRAHLLVEPVS